MPTRLRRQAAINLIPGDVHEPPIFEQLVAWTYGLVGSEQLWVSRIFSALFWSIGGLALFFVARRHTSFGAALVGLAFYLCLPFAIQSSRSFQPDPWMVMWILLAVWAIDHWMETPSWKWTIAAGALGGMAFLVKVMAGFFLAGTFSLAVLYTLGLRGMLRSLKPWVMALLVAAPAVIYYLVLNSGRSADYFTFWTVGFAQMLLTSRFYVQWLAMINGLTGLTILAVAIIGVVIAAPRFRWILIGLWIGYVLFGMAWPFQYTTHEYYHMALIPIIGLSLTPVADLLLKQLFTQNRIWRIAGVGVILAAAGFQLYVGRSQLIVNDYSAEPRSWQKVSESIPAGASFVALTNDYGVRLNYFGFRGASYYWPGQGDLDLSGLRGNAAVDTAQLFKDVTQGKSYFLVTAMGELEKQPDLKAILQTYPVAVQGSGWVVYDLSKAKP